MHTSRILCLAFLAAIFVISVGSAQQPMQDVYYGEAREEAGSDYQGPSPDPEYWPEPTHYISPDGSDQNTGTSPDSPWGTFDHALAQLRPGDVLGVMDGTYRPNTTGMVSVNCGNDGSNWNGLRHKQITVRAVNERQAIFESDGLAPAVWITRCRNWNVLGLTARGQDTATDANNPRQLGTKGMEPVYVLVGVHKSRNIALKRMLAIHSNRLGKNANNHIYAVENSSHVLVEESEAYEHHRHAFICWRSEYVTFRRNYVNPRDHRIFEGFEGGSHRWSDEAIAYYRGSWGIAENNIVEGRNVGYHAHGGDTYRINPAGSWNRFLGNIALNNYHSSRIDARRTPYPQAKPAIGNVFRDFLVVGLQGGIGLWYSTATRTEASNVTVYGGDGTGFQADSRSNPPCETVEPYGGCTHRLTNALIFDNAEVGISNIQQDQWLVEYANSFNNGEANYDPSDTIDDEEGNIRHSMSVKPTGMGLDQGECIVFVPESSNMSGAGADGADIGANILYRYRNGTLTDHPLWDPETGAFPHGALVDGINDIDGNSLFDVHERLNVNTNGCTLPYSE